MKRILCIFLSVMLLVCCLIAPASAASTEGSSVPEDEAPYRAEIADIVTPVGFSGSDVWTDGTDVYCRSNSAVYNFSAVFDGSSWILCNDGGFFGLSGSMFWSHDGTIYYSSDSLHLRLDDGVLVEIEPGEPCALMGSYVWSDGANTYYSCGEDQLIFDGSAWSSMTWSGLTEFYGEHVWSDGSRCYYSEGGAQYVLDGTTWEPITWSGLSSILGSFIWSDGVDVYYSQFGTHYVLDGTAWTSIEFVGAPAFSGNSVWSDGDDYYVSESGSTVSTYRLLTPNTSSGSTAPTTDGILSSIGAVFEGALSMAAIAAATVASHPLLLIGFVVGLIGVGIIIYRRLT